jgi:hypothetical protein
MPEHEGEAAASMQALIAGIPNAEVHLKPDAAGIAYRRWLKELGLSTGVI